MSNLINMPVSGSHAVDRFKTNMKYSAKTGLTVGATGLGMCMVAPKETLAAGERLFSGITKFKPEAKSIIGKTGEICKNIATQSGTAWKTLPGKAKVIFGAGLAATSLLALGNNYKLGKIDGKHETIKKILKQTNGNGLYI